MNTKAGIIYITAKEEAVKHEIQRKKKKSVLENKIKLVYLHYYKNINRGCTDGYVSSVLVLSVFSLRKKKKIEKSQNVKFFAL